MFYSSINKVIEEVNLVIKHALKDKIFLACSVFAVIVVLFSLLCKLNKLEWVGILLTISSSMARAIEYSWAHQTKREKRKMVIGSELLFQTIIAMIVGIIIFYDKTIKNPSYIHGIIAGNENLVFMICLIIPAAITIFAKIIFSSGEPLYGGVISGHSAFVTALFLLNYQNETAFPLLVLPMIAILIPRCTNIASWLKSFLKVSGGLCMFVFCVSIITSQKNMTLIMANILMLLLVILCQGKPVHKKREILFGIITGIIPAIITLYIFR